MTKIVNAIGQRYTETEEKAAINACDEQL